MIDYSANGGYAVLGHFFGDAFIVIVDADGEMESQFQVNGSLDIYDIAEIKEEISSLSQQIKTTLAEIKQMRKTLVMKALEDDIRLASTEYAMKFELKRPEYDKAMSILQVTLTKMPEEAVAYKQKVITWIAKAQNDPGYI